MPITLEDLQRPNDLLVQWDRRPEHEDRCFLRERFESPALADAFHACAQNRETRALLELRINGCIAAEDFEHLLGARRVGVADEPYRTLVANAHGASLWKFGVTRGYRPTRGRANAEGLLNGAVRGYLVRHTGAGVVLRTDVLEQTLDLPDWEVLRLAIDPRSGRPLLDTLPRDLPLWDVPRLEDPLAARRARFTWWTTDEREPFVHDSEAGPEPETDDAERDGSDPGEPRAPPFERDELAALRELRAGLEQLLRRVDGVSGDGTP